jgi:hypothetical protein
MNQNNRYMHDNDRLKQLIFWNRESTFFCIDKLDGWGFFSLLDPLYFQCLSEAEAQVIPG